MISARDVQTMRDEVLKQVQAALPRQQEYFTGTIAFVRSLKYVDERGNLSYMNGSGIDANSMKPHDFHGLPLEALIDLRDWLIPNCPHCGGRGIVPDRTKFEYDPQGQFYCEENCHIGYDKGDK